MFTVASVPYLNAKPLVLALEERADVRLIFDVPARLPSYGANASMVSSIEALRHPGRRVAGGVSISSLHEVLSVRLFSQVPFARIQRLALDQSSMTSNALARVLLAERYGVEPVSEPATPDLPTMLASADACILIGDNGMTSSGEGLHVMDLGLEWRRLTGLPFVWALWIGSEGLTPELAEILLQASEEGRQRLPEAIAVGAAERGLSEVLCARYLGEVMDYRLDVEHLQGLKSFGEALVRHSLIETLYWPKIVCLERAVS